jgi:hypothetical protein
LDTRILPNSFSFNVPLYNQGTNLRTDPSNDLHANVVNKKGTQKYGGEKCTVLMTENENTC